MKPTSLSAIILCVVLATLCRVASAAPGDLDLSFGGTGFRVDAIGSGSGRINELAVHSDGKIVASGVASNGTNNDFALMRYHPDGAIDTTFGSSGIILTDFANESDEAWRIAILNDGKILVSGIVTNSSQPSPAFVRYNSDGSLDGTFGVGGKVVASATLGPLSGNAAPSMAIQPDGKILFACQISSSNFCILRFNPDGNLDLSFNVTGIVETDFGNGLDYAQDVAVQANGRIVAACISQIGNGASAFGLARYTADGRLDSSFGGTGLVRSISGNVSSSSIGANRVFVLENGNILAIGTSRLSNFRIAVYRYLDNGFLDLTFNGTGFAIGTSSLGLGFGRDGAVQTDGKIVVVEGSTDFAAWRFNSTGSLDTSFGSGGKVTTSLGAGTDEANSIKIQTDGKLLIAGYSAVGSVTGFALARYVGVEPAPEIQVEYPLGTPLTDGAAALDYGNVLTGTAKSAEFVVKSVGGAALTGLDITFDGPDTADFTVTASPASPLAAASGRTAFTVRFAPTFAGTKTAALHIASNDADEPSFDIALAGRALAPSGDDDGETVSNEAELNLAALGFDPLVPDAATVTLLRDNGLSAGSDLQTVALHRPILEKNVTTGNFHLSIGLETSPDLHTWTPLLNFSPTYNPTTGRIEIEFTPDPATTQFFRVLGEKP